MDTKIVQLVSHLLISSHCRYLPKVFDRFAGAEGFVFLQDHMVLNYWNLLDADKSKLWITNKVRTLVLVCGVCELFKTLKFSDLLKLTSPVLTR